MAKFCVENMKSSISWIAIIGMFVLGIVVLLAQILGWGNLSADTALIGYLVAGLLLGLSALVAVLLFLGRQKKPAMPMT